MVSYGLAYGMESYGLAQRLAIPSRRRPRSSRPTSMAFPTCAPTWTGWWPRPGTAGYTETLFGRRRQIPELQSGRYQVRAAASARP